MSKKAVTYLIVIFVSFSLALHYPFVAVANKPSLIYGFPAFLIYLTFIWLLLIVMCFFVVRKGRSDDSHGH
ncbi:MAG: hypothetical protein AAF519_18985 [Bacteroidota bacterium]